jgi:hypothetical protein
MFHRRKILAKKGVLRQVSRCLFVKKRHTFVKKLRAMAVLTFEKIKVRDLDERLIESIRAYFKNNQETEISISVRPDSSSNPRPISELDAELEKSDMVYQLSFDDFDEIVRQFEADEHFDPVAAIEKFAVQKEPEPA